MITRRTLFKSLLGGIAAVFVPKSKTIDSSTACASSVEIPQAYTERSISDGKLYVWDDENDLKPFSETLDAGFPLKSGDSTRINTLTLLWRAQ
jgi:hypothetical protein